MKDLKLEIKYLPLEEVMPYANNARLHGEEDIDAIMASIQEFGFNDPIGIWHGIIVEGHGRLIAAKRLGMETVPTVSLDHLTDEERKAYALAHNRTAELSGWNFIVRDEELANIANIDMSQFGFTENEAEPEELDDGEIEDKTNAVICVKIKFENLNRWREAEEKLRELVDSFNGASVSVNEDYESYD